MKEYKKGDEVTVTFKGAIHDIYPGGAINIKRNHSGTISYFGPEELEHVSIIVHTPPFNPRSGEVYLLRPTGGKGIWTPWFVMRKSYLGDPDMVSPAGVFSLQSFKESYDNDSWEIVKANVEPE